MALQLDPTLAWAQDQKSRHPRVEIKSREKVADIPFDGQALTLESYSEFSPALLAHSSGRLILAYYYGPDALGKGGIKFVYTDTSRLEFLQGHTDQFPNPAASYTFGGISMCELTGGNIGVVYGFYIASYYYLWRRIITPTGVNVSAAEIANFYYNGNEVNTYPTVVTLGTNSYMMVYLRKTTDCLFYKRTSSNFTTWAAEAAVSVGGLTAANYKRNPSLTKLLNGNLWLWFDYTETLGVNNEELKNIYYSVSTDNGSTWSSAVKVTDYTEFTEVVKHPVAVQKTALEQTLMFTRTVGAINMNDAEAGWPTGADVTQICMDEPNGVAYLTCIFNSAGTKYLECVVKVKLSTWEVLDAWDTTTSPGFNIAYASSCWWHFDKGSRYLIPVTTNGLGMVSVLNGEADTITLYAFLDQPAYSVTKNINYTFPHTGYGINKTFIDFDNKRLWILLVSGYTWHTGIIVGYINLNEAGPSYTFNVIVNENVNHFTESELSGLGTAGYGTFEVHPDEDYIIISSGTYVSSFPGFLLIYTLDGNLYKEYKFSSYPDFPWRGICKFLFYDGKIWGSTQYQSLYGQGDMRGICEINIDQDLFIMHRPTYVAHDTYFYQEMPCLGTNGDMIWPDSGQGIAVYNAISETWTLWNNGNIGGMTPGAQEDHLCAAYWSEGEMILVGEGFTSSAWNGLVMFSVLYGAIQQTYYKEMYYSGSEWVFSDSSRMVLGFRDDEMVGAVDPSDSSSLYAFWKRKESTGVYSIIWDKEGSIFDLSPYLVNGEEVVCNRTIEQKPSTLSFTVSHGHLFDPFNPYSLLSTILKKGRKITLRWGELVGVSTYWQDGGSFYVTQAVLSFERGKYTNVQVECEDERTVWGQHEPITTEYYNDYPEVILKDILKDQVSMIEEDIDIPEFDNRTRIVAQWIETPIEEIINQICNRYGYYFRLSVSGKANTRKVSVNNAVDHVYSDLAAIMQYAPDDKYSDFVNRVVVTGQEQTFIEVQFAEERVKAIQGTVGWWGYKNDFTVNYSEDGSRRCIYPKLVVIESSTSIAFKLSGKIQESISFEDPAYHYCIVTVKAPNLTFLLLAGVAVFLLGSFIPDGVTGIALGFIASGVQGNTIPIGRIIEKVGIFLCMMVLGAVGNYQYEVWATPLGNVRRSIQSQADDTDAQATMGTVISKKFEDPFCYTTADCYNVAAYELMIAKAQRKRLNITKVAHLQDEEGDTIQLLHPYSRASIYMFITNLKRSMKPGKGGHFLDEIEGWVRS